MELLKRVPLWLVIVLAGAMAAIALKVLKPTPKPSPLLTTLPAQVEVVAVQPKTLALSVHTQGTVAPRREIDLVAEVAGRVLQVADNFVSGDFFSAGQTLVQIDDANYQLAKIRAQARVAEAQQLLATEKGRALQAKREWRDLGNADANDLFLRKPQLAAAQAQLLSAKADLDQTLLDLDRTRISAPFPGRIRETHVNLGQYVAPGTKVARIFDSEVVEIRLPITDAQAALLNLTLGYRAKAGEGPKVTITGVIAGVTHQWQGHIARTDASLDTQTRMYHAVAEVEQSSSQIPLVVGLFVDADIEGRPIDQVIALPRSAIYKHNTLVQVDGTHRIRILPVSVLATDATHAWITADLQAGDLVATSRQGYLQPNQLVTPEIEPKIAPPTAPEIAPEIAPETVSDIADERQP